jgi:glucokinase
MTPWRLISDVGGTNVRFARVFDEDHVVERLSYPVVRFRGFLDALRRYTGETGGLAGCCGAAIGAAGPVASGSAKLTNISWIIDDTEVASEIGAPCTVINDVEAAAYCLPALSPSEFIVLSGPSPNVETAHRLLAANIGTGFGAAGLIKTPAGWISSPSEAGHMTLSPPAGLESRMRPRFKTVEAALSGRGLSNLHAALSGDAPLLAAAEICARAASDAKVAATISVFADIVGDVLGNLTLALAAWDGVFLFGSVAKGFAHAADRAAFRKAFENKGPMKAWMERVPLALVEKEDAALYGLAALSVRNKV